MILTVFSFAVMSCGTSPYLKEPVDENVSLVFGYIDMSEATNYLGSLYMKRLSPSSADPFYGFICVDGMFYLGDIPPGIYKMYEFSGGNTIYSLPPQGKMPWDPVIEKPGLYYMGTYTYKNQPSGFFELGKFGFEKSDTPSEKELLEKLLKYAGDTKWKAMIEKRIGEL